MAEVSEGVGEPWEGRERRVPAGTWVRRRGSPGPLKVTPLGFGLVFHGFFFSLSCFWAKRTVILPANFLVLLHPSVLQSVLGGRNHGAEL